MTTIIDFPAGWSAPFGWPGEETTAITFTNAHPAEIFMVYNMSICNPVNVGQVPPNCSSGEAVWVIGDENISSLQDWPIKNGNSIMVYSNVAWTLEIPDSFDITLYLAIGGVALVGVALLLSRK